ncbi:hypothetical protein [Acinetobacter schindleri]|uniref:hypothetical protein n=1 Tax=Acinetobacter schindleri TaxID=108981 RepID=UPI002899A709|nr:hypothetical protein [Acinetobacter schindleri]
MAVILYIISFIIYVLLVLAPYYVAYLIIEPHSFLGVVGVFLLGSVIVPLTIMLAGLCMAVIGGILKTTKDTVVFQNKSDIESSYDTTIKTVTEDTIPKKKNSKAIFIISIVGLIVAITLAAIFGRSDPYENSYNYKQSDYEQTDYQEEVESASEVTFNELLDNSEDLEAENSSASYIEDDYQLMTNAVNSVFNILDQSGMSGVAKQVRDCYVNPNMNKLYCVYFDTSARLFDSEIASSLKFPRNEYLADGRSKKRANDYVYQPLNIYDGESHLQKIEKELWVLLDQTAKNRYQANTTTKSDLSPPSTTPQKGFGNEINEQFKNNASHILHNNGNSVTKMDTSEVNENFTEFTADEANQLMGE